MSKTPRFSVWKSCRSRRLTWTRRLSTCSPALKYGGWSPAFLIWISF